MVGCHTHALSQVSFVFSLSGAKFTNPALPRTTEYMQDMEYFLRYFPTLGYTQVIKLVKILLGGSFAPSDISWDLRV